MKTSIVVAALILLAALWWFAAAPRDEIGCCVAEAIVIDSTTGQATDAVDRSDEFAASLEVFPLDLPAYDDAVFLDEGRTALATAHDGRIWRLDVAAMTAEPIADVPLMAWGIHEVPGDSGQVYFCAAGTYEGQPSGEVPGLYRLSLDTGAVEALVVKVPDTVIDRKQPRVYADSDPEAPELKADGSGGPSRPLAVCDNLDVSEDGARIYFSEPFSYRNASIDDAIDEAIALAPNGRLWRYDLETDTTRLIAEVFHFINGVIYDLHPGQAREDSVLVSQTSLFRVTRFHLAGPKAGSAEVVIDGLPGTPDGMDRDAEGRLWLAMFAPRGRLLTWVHEHACIKLSPDGSAPLYSAFYEGPPLFSIASAVPAPSGIYLANVAFGDSAEEQTGVQRLKWPAHLETGGSGDGTPGSPEP
jgi:sugar lactone lactonase YvrE